MSDVPPSGRFQVEILGPFRLRRDDAPIDTGGWQRRVETLFKLLVTAPRRRLLRDDLMEALWPDATSDAAGGNLRIVVHRLRQALNAGDPSPVITEHGWVMLNPAYEWDVDLELFECLAGRQGDLARLLEAAALYRGEPLPEERYENWATPVRDRVQRAWRNLCLDIAAAYQARDLWDAAADWFERVLADDGLDEEALRGLLSALHRSGRRSEALRRYQAFETALREEMDVAPSPETLALATRIRVSEDDGRGTSIPLLPTGRFLGATPPGPLIDREDELERLRGAIDAAEAGMGRMILICGEAGVGKTRLTQETMLILQSRGYTVAAGRCYERESDVPLFPLEELFPLLYAQAPASLRTEAARRRPDLERLLVGGATRRPMADSDSWPPPAGDQALARALAEFAGAMDQPVAILIDDLQWADRSTLGVIEELARRGHAGRTLLLATSRDPLAREHPASIVQRNLAREGLLERIALNRLSLESTGQMIATLIGEVEGGEELTEFVYRRSKGNAYFIDRMVNALGNRYRLVRQIGAGGMGRVFEAVDTLTGTRIAAKLMFARTEADPGLQRRFEQEGEVLAAIRHPNIVRVYGTFVDEHSACIMMELLRGDSLGRLLEQGPLSLPRARGIAEQVAAALAAAHERGVIHRDVKPDNIMVDERDHVTVTDFGIARMARRNSPTTTLTTAGMTIGTPLYMAPEQVEGRTLDPRADVYSLGAVMYRMVCGRAPFEADDPLTVAFKQVHETAPPPSTVNPRLPGAWDAVIERAMAKDPAQRFPTADAMQEAIAALPAVEAFHEKAAPQPVGARRVPRAPAAASLALVATLVIAGAVYALTRPGAASAPRAPARPVLVFGQEVLDGPAGVAVDGHSNVWVVDQGSSKLDEFSSDGKLLRSVGRQGAGPGDFNGPTDVAVAPDGIVYVAEFQNQRIQQLSPDLTSLQMLAYYPRGSVQGTALSSVAVDARGDVYATDYSRSRVRVFSPAGALLQSWGSRGSSPGQLNSPDGVAVDRRNRLVYVSDKYNYRVVKFTLDGRFLGAWGSKGSGQGQFLLPAGVAVDENGNVYVVDTLNNRVEEFTPSGRYLRAWGRFGTGYLEFDRPAGVAVAPSGIIYVTDYYHHRVEKILPSRGEYGSVRR